MRRILTICTLALVLPAGAARADNDCRVPAADWQSREAVLVLAKEKGWTVTRIETDDGCYEIRGRDGEGRELKATLDPAALAIIKLQLGEGECSVPMADWRPREAVQALAKEKGWTVQRIRIDDGCYEIKGRDGEGRKIEIALDPATLAVVETEYEYGNGAPGRSLAPAPAGMAGPSADGLPAADGGPVAE